MSTFVTALSLTPTGAHAGSWRLTDRPVGGIDPQVWIHRAISAEQAGIDILTIPDTLTRGADAGALDGRLDAVAIAARLAPVTARVGLVPTVTTTHTEPFHLQAAIATLDWVSRGRAGWQLDVSTSRSDAEVVGRRAPASSEALWLEATDVGDVARKLWDSWEDDAEIRDTATGRFIDRDKLHYVDYTSTAFSIKGPSIVPRPPQGHPVTFVGASGRHQLAAAAHTADVILLSADDPDEVDSAIADAQSAVAHAGRDPRSVRYLVDWLVTVARSGSEAAQRSRTLEQYVDRDSRGTESTVRALSVDQLVDSLARLADSRADGLHLRPAAIPDDFDRVLDAIRQSGLATGATSDVPTLRERLGLERPANQYAAAASQI